MRYCSHWSWSYSLTTVKLENCQHWQSNRLPEKKEHVSATSKNIYHLKSKKVTNMWKLTSREMFGQYEALRTWRLPQVRAISRSVSSLTHEQLDISMESKSGQVIAAERIAASESLWQEAISRSRKRLQFSTACAMLLRFNDNVWSCGHL